MINIISSSRYKINRKLVRKKTTDFLLSKGVNENNTINLVFVGRNKMKDISNKYKNEDVALPVLSFLYNEREGEKNFLGEIIICYPQAILLAADRNKAVDEIMMSLVEHGIKNLLK